MVCNSGHGVGGNVPGHLSSSQAAPRSLHRWPGHTPPTMDLPPSYDSLFPHGPPSPRGCVSAAPPTPASAASLDITATTTSMLSLGSSQGGVSPGHGYPNAAPAATTTQTSNIIIPLSAICSPTHSSAITKSTTTASHSTAGESSTSASAGSGSPKPTTSAVQPEGHSVEFTPLVQPEDSAISLSSLCSGGELSAMSDNAPQSMHHHASHSHASPSPSVAFQSLPPYAASSEALQDPPEHTTSYLPPN